VRRNAAFLDRVTDLRIEPDSPLPKHRQLFEGLRRAIREGKLGVDDELPSTRELARELGVSRNTALAAYEMLTAEGYVTSRGGAGTFVARNAVEARPAEPRAPVEPRPLSDLADMFRVFRLSVPAGPARPFRASSPSIDAFPYAAWAHAAQRVLRRGERAWMSAGEPSGLAALRKAIARHVHAFRSTPCDPDQIIVTSGAQSGLFLCSMLLLDANDVVWIENPGYQHARWAFRTRTQRVIPVPLDEAGMDIEAGRGLSPQPRVIFTTPTHQWPLGIAMSATRKRSLLDFAARFGAWVIEDDYDGDLRFERKTYAALRSDDHANRVIHLGSFTETLTPGIRIGFLVVPPDLVDAFVAARQTVDRFPNPIAQAILADFIENGNYARHVYQMQMLYRERHELMRARISSTLGGFLAARPASGGTFTVAELMAGVDDVALADAFERDGYESLPLSRTYVGSPGRHGFLLGHAVAAPKEIRVGIDRLARIAARPASRLPSH
jgi:GntR family transcriptional regulator / MocR family aminotransferase